MLSEDTSFMHSTRNDSDEDSAKAQQEHRAHQALFMSCLKISQTDSFSFVFFAAQDRFVLVIDFWHPDLTIPEREEREPKHGSFVDIVKHLYMTCTQALARQSKVPLTCCPVAGFSFPLDD